ncbi:MAG: ABC transporter ATP-binding protein [Peptococcaceae bacterium]|jgi:oligopeptide/dipeptide ABC transporter ATP-binding protein|nr:ABC transporter ATP-binding protein [Peptococcaceae bacterium]
MLHVPLIEVKNLSQHYRIKTGAFWERKVLKAVEGLYLTINQGDIFGLVGESGCGKTTLGQLIAGVIPGTGGEILYNGQSVSGMGKDERRALRKQIQMVFQDPYSSLNPKKRVGWIIEEPLKIHFRYPKSKRDSLVDEMMELVGLDPGLKPSFPSGLSGGQRQRVSIAAALMGGATFLVADECVSSLDVSVQAQILNLLVELREKKGLTILFISHDLNVIRFMSSRIGVMYMGKIVEMGGCEEVCDHPAHPYTQMLLSAVPSEQDPIGLGIIPSGEVPDPLDPPSGCSFHNRCIHAMEVCKRETPAPLMINPCHQVCCHRYLHTSIAKGTEDTCET